MFLFEYSISCEFRTNNEQNRFNLRLLKSLPTKGEKLINIAEYENAMSEPLLYLTFPFSH